MKRSFFYSSLAFFLIFQMSSVFSQSLPKWGLVYGSDTKPDDAKREILRFNNSNPQAILPQFKKYKSKASLFLRKGTYRSVLLFNTEKDAKNALPIIELTLTNIDKQTMTSEPTWKRGSFIVNLNVWCPKWYSQSTNLDAKEGKIKLYKCQ